MVLLLVLQLRTEAKQVQLSKVVATVLPCQPHRTCSITCAVMQVVDALHCAGSDKRVQGIVACIGDAQQYVALAQVQELRNAILDFRYVLFVP